MYIKKCAKGLHGSQKITTFGRWLLRGIGGNAPFFWVAKNHFQEGKTEQIEKARLNRFVGANLAIFGMLNKFFQTASGC